MAHVVLKNINKIYPNGYHAVHGFSFELFDKEFVVFVGPSGCGKSTTLRMIAGLEDITNGELFVNNVLFNNVAPQDRDIAMVFQNYALYPHMTVYDNMAFGLRNHKIKTPLLDENGEQVKDIDSKTVKFLEGELKRLNAKKNSKKLSEQEKSYIEEQIKDFSEKLEEVKNTLIPQYKEVGYSKEEINERVLASAKILDIEQYLNQKPRSLSGGQCQRVALGRAIVRNPKLFLMDEPLSNLDAKLRVAMRSEIVDLHKKVGATTIYVTHDQTEAMTMADKIIVMSKGYIQQIGKPEEIYLHPANKFVATFIGSPQMNLFDVTLDIKKAKLVFNKYEFKLTKEQITKAEKEYKAYLEQASEEIEIINKNLITQYELKNSKTNNPKKLINIEEAIANDEVLNEKKKFLEELKAELKEGILKVTLGVRPEDFHIEEKGDIDVKIGLVELLGAQVIIHAYLNEEEIRVTAPQTTKVNAYGKGKLSLDMNNIHFFIRDENGKAIL